MAEWLKALVLKTSIHVKCIVGSNPTIFAYKFPVNDSNIYFKVPLVGLEVILTCKSF